MKFLITVFILAGCVSAQQPGQLSLGGTVINAKTGQPISRALVTVNSVGGLSEGDEVTPRVLTTPVTRTSFTDSSGAYRFSGLPAGQYLVTARKPEFVEESSEDNRNSGYLKLSASTEGVTKRLSPLGVVTGTITDQYGLPLPGSCR